VQKEEKLEDLLKLILGMIERRPAQRSRAVDLLKLKVFEEPDEAIVSENEKPKEN